MRNLLLTHLNFKNTSLDSEHQESLLFIFLEVAFEVKLHLCFSLSILSLPLFEHQAGIFVLPSFGSVVNGFKGSKLVCILWHSYWSWWWFQAQRSPSSDLHQRGPGRGIRLFGYINLKAIFKHKQLQQQHLLPLSLAGRFEKEEKQKKEPQKAQKKQAPHG